MKSLNARSRSQALDTCALRSRLAASATAIPLTKEGTWPGIEYPRVPGHEIAGIIDAVGEGVAGWTKGQRVGVGWHGGHCGHCDSCRRGDFVTCQIAPQIPGISYDGGYAEYVIAPAGALALIPEGLSAVEAAPLMCAGVTTFNSLRNSGARPGDLVAILGVGGSATWVFSSPRRWALRPLPSDEAATLSRWPESLAPSNTLIPIAGFRGGTVEAGRRQVVLATAPDSKAMSAILGGLGVNGKLVVIGVSSEPLQVPGIPLIREGGRSRAGPPATRSILRIR